MGINDPKIGRKSKARLRIQAAHRSMEEKARDILPSALQGPMSTKENLATAIHNRFAAFGGLKLQLPSRDAIRRIPVQDL